MSRREYDDYGRGGGNVEYIPAPATRPRSSSTSAGYRPPGGFPESPKESYQPRTTYPAQVPVAMPSAPVPPEDYAAATIGRRPPSPGVRFAEDYKRGPPPRGERSPPRGGQNDPARRSGGATNWQQVYERERAQSEEMARERAAQLHASNTRDARERGGPPPSTSSGGPPSSTSRGLDINLNTNRVKGSFSLGGRESKKEKRDNDLAWDSDEDSSEDERAQERLRERERRRRYSEKVDREREDADKEKERADRIRYELQQQQLRDRERDAREQELRERDRERERDARERELRERENRERERREHDHRRTASGVYDGAYGDPRRSAGQLVDPRRSAGALPLSSGDPRRSVGDFGDPRRSSGHVARYDDPYYRRESPPSDERDLAGVRYVSRPRDRSPHSSSATYISDGGRRSRADSVGRRHPSVAAIDTGMAVMSMRDREKSRDRYADYRDDGYRPSYYDLSPMPSPSFGPRDRGFAFDVGGNFSLGSSLGGASAGYSASASAGRDRKKDDQYIRPEEKKRTKEPRYDPGDHAALMYKALKGKVADVSPIVKILPLLSGNQVLDLRAEYKKVHPLAKVNLAKHLKAQLTGKVQLAAFVTACGPWESEAYWATLSKQKPNFRHALLIEAIFGRENDDILDIKDSYRDSKNDNNFEKAVSAELSADKATGDKFKELVLIQLDARGMNEWDKVYVRKIQDDAEDLHDELGKEKVDSLFVGKIIISRSTTHLRELMRYYKKQYDGDLARLIAQKISGLVGEALLHVLNGVLNKPARDARLLEESMKGVGTRDDLLVARLVRIHWDPDHMTAVKEAYKNKYNMTLEKRIQGECTGYYQEFLINLTLVDTHSTELVKV